MAKLSGDGDSASIGIGQFAHIMRRGVNLTYILENNGVFRTEIVRDLPPRGV